MSLHRRDAARDANEPEIVRAFRTCGWKLIRHSAYDLEVKCPRCHGISMVEVKMPPDPGGPPSSAGRLTKSQRVLLDDGWPLKIVRTVEDVARLIANHNHTRHREGE